MLMLNIMIILMMLFASWGDDHPVVYMIVLIGLVTVNMLNMYFPVNGEEKGK